MMKLTEYKNENFQAGPEGKIEFFSPEGIEDHGFLVLKVKNTSRYLQGIQLGFWKKSSEESDLNVTFGIIPQLETILCLPLHYLDGQTMFLPRSAGTLKRVVFGRKILPSEVDRISISLDPHFESQSLEILDIHFAKEEPVYTVPDTLLVDAMGQSTLYDWEGKTHSQEELAQNIKAEIEKNKNSSFPETWSEYGGDLSLKYEETGFFHTHYDEKLEQWLLVDPKGHGFFSVGLDCVNLDTVGKVDDFPHLFQELKKDGVFAPAYQKREGPHSGIYYNFSQANMLRVFPENSWETWAELTKNRLKSWCFNTIGNWSEEKFCHASKLPYVLPLKDFPSTKIQIFRDFPDVFSEEYRKNSETFAEQLKPLVDDPYFIGYFLRNEPLWAFVVGMNLAEELLETDFPSKTKEVLIADLQEKYGDISALNTAWKQEFSDFSALNQPVKKGRDFSPQAKSDLEAFSHKMIESYVSLPSIACKKVDKNHLNLGMRYAYIWDSALLAGCEHFDVFSFNCYKMNPVEQIISIGDMTNLPVMIGEFHFGAVDKGLMSTGLKGVSSQKERGTAYQFYVENAAAEKYCVGTHYFTLNDQAYLGRFDGENFQIGVVDCCQHPYEDFVEGLLKTNQEIYQVKKKQRPPSSIEGKEIPRIGF
ncbi:MAG: beta-galactosidase [Eubacteriales bacterium]